MAKFEIGGIAYQSKLMDGEMQIAVLRRLLPTFTALVGHAPSLKKSDSAEPEGQDADTSIFEVFMPVVRELAALTDADEKFILTACLDVTQRQVAHGVGWASVVQRGVVQDQGDAKFRTRLTIAWHVLAENFGEMLRSFGLDVEALAQAAPKGLSET